jgi:7-keto-8-aminopelargonate synthetase-like enzyme
MDVSLHMDGPKGPRIRFGNKEYDYFDGCSYFGLHWHPELIATACRAMQQQGVTTHISRHFATPITQQVEAAAAKFFGTEAALYHPTGYLGVSTVLEGIPDEYDTVFMDDTSHYSARHAVAAARKPMVVFAHRDADDLRKQLKKHLAPKARPLLLTDGCFPISGQLAPLADYHQVLREYPGFQMVVDDAHVTGVIGKTGCGTFEHFSLKGDNLHTSGTLSKAMGAHGGIIAGSQDFIDKLHLVCKGASSSAVPVAAAAIWALDHVRTNPALRTTLWELVRHTKAGLRELGYTIPDTPVPIICLHSHPRVDPKALREALLARGIHCQYREEGSYTSVPKGGSNRIAIIATHTREQIDRLLAAVAEHVHVKA